MNFKLIFASLVYVFALHFSYNLYILENWSYVGYFEKNILSLFDYIYSSVIILIPVIILKNLKKRISQIFFIFFYIIIYAPTIIVITYSWKYSYLDYYLFTSAYFIAFTIMAISTRIKIYKFKLFNFNPRSIFKVLFFIYIFLIFSVLSVNIDSLSFVDFTDSVDVYQQRESGPEASTSLGYIILILVSSIIPFLMSYSLYKKKYSLILLFFLSFILLYSVVANRSYLFMPLFILIVFYIFKNIKKYKLEKKIFYFFSFSLIFLSSVMYLGNENLRLLFFFPSAFLIFRTIFTGGWQSIVYYEFFSIPHNEITYLSQTKFFNLFSDYEYYDLLGRTIGYYVFEDANLSLNSNFLISDGLASFWFVGIIVFGIFYSLIFYVIDCVSFDIPNSIVISCMVFSIISLSNTSIFTTLLSGGLFLLILIFSSVNFNKL